MHVSWALSVVQRTSMLHACLRHRPRSSSDLLAEMLITFTLLPMLGIGYNGSNSEVRARNREVRFALKNGLHQVSLSGPKSANGRPIAALLMFQQTPQES